MPIHLTAWTYSFILVKAFIILKALSNEPCTATFSKTHAVCIQDAVVGDQSAMQTGNKHNGCDFKNDSSATARGPEVTVSLSNLLPVIQLTCQLWSHLPEPLCTKIHVSKVLCTTHCIQSTTEQVAEEGKS